MADSKYDENLEDQKVYKKPKHEATTAIYRDDAKSLKLLGTPACALAANTGDNVPDQTGPVAKASRVFLHVPSIKEIAGSRRATAVFLIAHEFKHLLNHDPEEMEVHNLKHFNDWCTANPEPCASDDALATYTPIGDKAREKFLRPLEDRADHEAADWLEKLVDPKTGKKFGRKAAEEALEEIGRWAKQKGWKADGQHASIHKRIELLRQKRKEAEVRTANIAAKGARAVRNTTEAIKESKY